MNKDDFLKTTYQYFLDLVTEEGINASGKEEIYGCIFGRDSAITILKLLKLLNNPNISFLDTCRLLEVSKRSLLTLVSLAGRESNIESGEEPGKFIHEYRTEKYDHLVNKSHRPWFLYSDGIMRNYDSIDATPLMLIALYRYWEKTQDTSFLLTILPAVESGLNWIISYGDRDKDSLLEYELPKERKHGGLVVQSWTDSSESMLCSHGNMPEYPIAPVEVQGYAWLALKLWADFYACREQNYAKRIDFARKLRRQAEVMKRRFNQLFLLEDNESVYAAQALDGYKRQIKTITGNPLLTLWATYHNNGVKEAIIEKEYIPKIVERAFQNDMFEEDAGIRTMSTQSLTFNSQSNSYHNGSFWPKLNGMSHEGLEIWGFTKEAKRLKSATLKPILHFGTPIELYVKTEKGEYQEFCNGGGQVSCKNQAWSAAVALDLLTL